MRALLAFDKFKDSLTAPAACAAAARALRESHPDWTLDLCPLADGGEGFCEILTQAAAGTVETHTVTGPRSASTAATLGFVSLEKIPVAARALLEIEEPKSKIPNPTVAIIEMASASGLALLNPSDRDPWQTHTGGTGELIRLAASRGVTAILLGVGGSATHDLGLGALATIGLEFLTAEGERVSPPLPARWPAIVRISGSLPPGLPPIRIACDVTNPLTGPRGAAATYGPQKGLRPADLAQLDAESGRLARLLCTHCGRPDSTMETPGAGAAGGIAFGLMTAARARLLPGFELVDAWLDIARRLAAADLVITGEGRFDNSSLQGKGPGAVAARALALGKKVHVFAGRASVARPPAQLILHSITPDNVPLDQALREAAGNLTAAVRAAL
ncbi:MAG: glycerate kinase [Opitutaceae bacterium]|nr:glycerate kinase [Opitutaceae bacterium]